MALGHLRPVANGLHTDHPIPDLPFVDDSHLPLGDPDAVEALGRHHNGESWGRTDRTGDGGWIAFTTDQAAPQFAWLIRSHPVHGRSVMLFRDEQVAHAYTAHTDPEPALLFRAGDYWWDGATWSRPPQVWDPLTRTYVRRSVPAARTVSAEDLLSNSGADASRARLLEVSEVVLDEGGKVVTSSRWLDDLAAWAAHRRDQTGEPAAGAASGLGGCVVSLTAPELSGEQLVGVVEFAQIAGISASTLRAYMSRGEGEVPYAQATISTRAVWARPVAEEWAERRRLDITPASGPSGSDLAPGLQEVSSRFATIFHSRMWANPSQRKRWALRWRTEDSVNELATGLGWDVAASLRTVVPVSGIAHTIYLALLRECTVQREFDGDEETHLVAFDEPTIRALRWLIRHYPDNAATTISEAITAAEADDALQLPRQITAGSLYDTLISDSRNSPAADPDITAFLDKLFAHSLAGRS